MTAPRFTVSVPGGRTTRKYAYITDVPTPEDITAIMGYLSADGGSGLKNWSLVIAITLMYRGCLRRAECLAVRPADISFARNELSVTRGKGGKYRVIGLDDRALEIIRGYLDFRASVGIDASLPLVLTRDFSRYTERGFHASFRKAVRDAATACGLPQRRWNCHSFRHAGTIAMLHDRIALPVISRQLGHSNLRTTLVYLRRFDADDLGAKMKNRNSWGIPAQSMSSIVDTGIQPRTRAERRRLKYAALSVEQKDRIRARARARMQAKRHGKEKTTTGSDQTPGMLSAASP